MKVTPIEISNVPIIESRLFSDGRGFFFESFNQRAFNEATRLNETFVRDNHSRSAKGVLWGLSYQTRHSQGKLVRLTRGEVFDVAVDLRRIPPHLDRWVTVVASFIASAARQFTKASYSRRIITKRSLALSTECTVTMLDPNII